MKRTLITKTAGALPCAGRAILLLMLAIQGGLPAGEQPRDGIKAYCTMQPMIGRHTRLLTCLANWNGKDPTAIVPAALKEGIGLYGFTKPQADSLVPMEPCLTQPVSQLKGDARNIGALARAYHGVSLDSVKNAEGLFIESPR